MVALKQKTLVSAFTEKGHKSLTPVDNCKRQVVHVATPCSDLCALVILVLNSRNFFLLVCDVEFIEENRDKKIKKHKGSNNRKGDEVQRRVFTANSSPRIEHNNIPIFSGKDLKDCKNRTRKRIKM